MTLSIATEGGRAVVTLAGEIDGKTAPEVEAGLIPVFSQVQRVILDMSGVTYLSSAGLRLMLLLDREAKSSQVDLCLAGLIKDVRDTMAMTGFLKFFKQADSLAEALQTQG